MNESIPLGKQTEYPEQYDASLLFPVARKEKRDEIAIGESLPFVGADIWTGYECSWLNKKGKPQVAIAEFVVPCESPFLIESKSFKLYLNSFNQMRFDTWQDVQSLMEKDLSAAANADVSVSLFTLDEYQSKGFGEWQGECLDGLDIECHSYSYQPELLKVKAGKAVHQQWYSHLLKSNCLITSQPDWGSVWIDYVGQPIDQEGLLKYIVSFRNHNEFHEQCVERIFQDILQRCQPSSLTVLARYTRRGGLDINPWRSNASTIVQANRPTDEATFTPGYLRLARQ